MIMDREQLTAGAFAESIDVAQATISHILSSRNNPSTEVILKLHKRYNDINLEEKTISINKSYQRLKGKDMMKWIGLMNNIRACADEIVLNDIVYS